MPGDIKRTSNVFASSKLSTETDVVEPARRAAGERRPGHPLSFRLVSIRVEVAANEKRL
jgi:hypothetical protein